MSETVLEPSIWGRIGRSFVKPDVLAASAAAVAAICSALVAAKTYHMATVSAAEYSVMGRNMAFFVVREAVHELETTDRPGPGDFVVVLQGLQSIQFDRVRPVLVQRILNISILAHNAQASLGKSQAEKQKLDQKLREQLRYLDNTLVESVDDITFDQDCIAEYKGPDKTKREESCKLYSSP